MLGIHVLVGNPTLKKINKIKKKKGKGIVELI